MVIEHVGVSLNRTASRDSRLAARNVHRDMIKRCISVDHFRNALARVPVGLFSRLIISRWSDRGRSQSASERYSRRRDDIYITRRQTPAFIGPRRKNALIGLVPVRAAFVPRYFFVGPPPLTLSRLGIPDEASRARDK